MKYGDDFFLWLIEQNHSSYLTWVAIWLAGILGTISILGQMFFRGQSMPSGNVMLVIFMIYSIIIGGISFCVYRLRNIVKMQIDWSNEIDDPKMKHELLKHRGWLSKFFVKDDGTPCEINLVGFLVLQGGFFLFLFWVAMIM